MKKHLILFLLLPGIFSVHAQDNRRPLLLAPADGDSLDIGTGAAVIKISGTDSQNAYSQLELIEFPDYFTPLHIHEKSDEVFYVIEGTLTLHLDGQRKEFEAGSIIMIPKGTPHAQGNFTSRNVRVLITLSPSGFEKFFIEREAIVEKYPPGTKEYGMMMRKLGETNDIKVIDFNPFETKK